MPDNRDDSYLEGALYWWRRCGLKDGEARNEGEDCAGCPLRSPAHEWEEHPTWCDLLNEIGQYDIAPQAKKMISMGAVKRMAEEVAERMEINNISGPRELPEECES